ARRRAVQRSGGNLAQDAAATADPEEERRILADLKRRDDYDSSRATSPLRPAEDAVIVDSSDMGFEDVVRKIASLSPALLARANA
ncbi:MAG: (d)CMP kinase, partial [Coriobacteriaceae bacterium]|nr:(d)CMP kinase [Coriobacteriaceae bacterium]